MKLKIILLILLTISFVGCKKHVSFHFPKNQKKVEIPFQYQEGAMISSVVIGQDTLKCIIDTGSNITLLSNDFGHGISNKTKRSFDFLGIEKNLHTTVLKEMQWKELTVKNLECAISDLSKSGVDVLIGTDILRFFCTTINNSQSKIILSRRRDTITDKNYIEVPLKRNGGNIYIQGELFKKKDTIIFNKKEVSLLLDTGFHGEISMPLNKEIKKNSMESSWKEPASSLFSNSNILRRYNLLDFKLGNKIFKDVIVAYSQRKNKNVILGAVFMSHFESITIDYRNKKVFFALPKNSKMGSGFDFTKDTLIAKTISYFNLLSHKINSLGVDFTSEYPFKINALSKNKAFTKVSIGDTLVGINNLFFDKRALSKAKVANKIYIGDKKIKRLLELYNATHQKAEVDFHFLKNGKLITEHLKRDYKFKKSPTLFYSFLPVNTNWGYFITHFQKDKNRNYTLHLPYSTVYGEKVTIQAYRKGKKMTISNKP